MQIRKSMVLLAAATLPFFAQAKEEHRKPSITPEALASMQAVVDYCAAVDARGAEFFRRQERSSLDAFNEDSVERVRGIATYRESYRADLAGYGQLPAGFGAAVCAAAVRAGSGGGHDDH